MPTRSSAAWSCPAASAKRPSRSSRKRSRRSDATRSRRTPRSWRSSRSSRFRRPASSSRSSAWRWASRWRATASSPGSSLGIAVIFAYYVVMFLAESFTKGLYASPGPTERFLFAYAARWMPDVVLGRVRHRGARLARTVCGAPVPARHPDRHPAAAGPLAPSAAAPTAASAAARRSTPAPSRRGVVIVLRDPAPAHPGPRPARSLRQPAVSRA